MASENLKNLIYNVEESKLELVITYNILTKISYDISKMIG